MDFPGPWLHFISWKFRKRNNKRLGWLKTLWFLDKKETRCNLQLFILSLNKNKQPWREQKKAFGI